MDHLLNIDTIAKYRALFWDAFHRPRLETDLSFRTWESLEHVNNMLAGPLFAYYENEGIDYIFEDNVRFESICNIQDFLDWAMSIIAYNKAALANLNPTTEVEIMDKNILNYQVDIKESLIKFIYKQTI